MTSFAERNYESFRMQNIFSVKTFRFRSKKWAAYASHSLIGDMFHYIFYFCYVLTIQVICRVYSSICSMQQHFSVKRIFVFRSKGYSRKGELRTACPESQFNRRCVPANHAIIMAFILILLCTNDSSHLCSIIVSVHYK